MASKRLNDVATAYRIISKLVFYRDKKRCQTFHNLNISDKILKGYTHYKTMLPIAQFLTDKHAFWRRVISALLGRTSYSKACVLNRRLQLLLGRHGTGLSCHRPENLTDRSRSRSTPKPGRRLVPWVMAGLLYEPGVVGWPFGWTLVWVNPCHCIVLNWLLFSRLSGFPSTISLCFDRTCAWTCLIYVLRCRRVAYSRCMFCVYISCNL